MPALYVTAPADALESLAGLMRRGTDVILIDGRAASGKTSLARALQRAAQVRGVPSTLVHMDRIYRGWEGLRAASEVVAEQLILPIAAGKVGYWDEYDWERERVLTRHSVRPGTPLIVEGGGAISQAAAQAAKASVWVTAGDETRRQRALSRDGDLAARHWGRWAHQEELLLAANLPQSIADVVVDTEYRERVAA